MNTNKRAQTPKTHASKTIGKRTRNGVILRGPRTRDNRASERHALMRTGWEIA